MKPCLILWLILLVAPSNSLAGEVTHSYVGYEDGHYHVRLVMKIEAEVDTVYAILTDFNHLHELNDSIKHSRLLHSKGKTHQVLFEIEGCVWIFCRRIKQVQKVTELANRYIQAEVLPNKSDMEYGRVLWHIVQQDELTIISYSADFVPAFFVPPLIGPYILKGRLLKEGQKTIEGIERIAQEEENY